MDKLLKLFLMPNYDGTVTNMGLLLGAEQDGEEIWLALRMEEITHADVRPAQRITSTAFAHQHMAQLWLDEWMLSLDELTLSSLVQRTRIVTSVPGVGKTLNDEKVVAVPSITKIAAAFMINALHGDVTDEVRDEMVGGEIVTHPSRLSVQDEQRALRQVESEEELRELEAMLDDEAENEEAELSEIVNQLATTTNWGDFS